MKLQPRRLYGKLLYAPMCDTSRLFVSLQRRKSVHAMLTKRELEIIKQLGYEIEMIPFIEENV